MVWNGFNTKYIHFIVSNYHNNQSRTRIQL